MNGEVPIILPEYWGYDYQDPELEIDENEMTIDFPALYDADDEQEENVEDKMIELLIDLLILKILKYINKR